MAVSTAKTVFALFDKILKQMDDNDVYSRQMTVDSMSASQMQTSSNIFWRNVQQQRKAQSGWDMTGLQTGIIEQNYPISLGTPTNDFIQVRLDDLRKPEFLDRAVMESVSTLQSDLNKSIADLVASTGTMYYESSSTGYDFVAEADTLMTERQINRAMGSSFFLNPRTNQVMAKDLASRDAPPTGISKSAWETALVNPRIAGFQVYRAPTYGSIAARANATTTTVASDVTEIPRGYTTSGGVEVNVDYRYGTVSLTAGTNYNVGDVITFAGVNALGIKDKTDTGELMTFRIIAKDTNDITVYPKPIAADQAGITTEQAAYANISTAIVSGMVVSKVNATGGQCNSFWSNDSIEIVNGDIPMELVNEWGGMKIESETISSGLRVYIGYDSNLTTLQNIVRVFLWYGTVNKDPSRNGNAIYTP